MFILIISETYLSKVDGNVQVESADVTAYNNVKTLPGIDNS